MPVKTLEQLPADGRRVFLRLDLNVPVDEEGNVVDDTRIQAAVPTIRNLIEREARIVIGSHLGRPDGNRLGRLSLEPVAARLAELMDVEIILSEDSIGDGPRKMAFALREGQIMMLENLRFYAGETSNEDSFSKQLSSLADMYVNDAFGTMHRPHASIIGVPKFFKDRGYGPLVEKELASLRKLVENPVRPFAAVIGGAKVKDKIEMLLTLVGHVDTLCIGGAMAFTFLAAKGVKLGASRVEMESLSLADKVLRKAASSNVQVLLPVDHVACARVEPGTPSELVSNQGFPPHLVAADIGPGTVELFSSVLQKAKTVFWNGPMGVFEIEPFHAGTEKIGRAVAMSSSYSVVGGADSVAAIRRSGLVPFIRHVSTGGRASLEYLEGKELPGLIVLDDEKT
jgi:phosphoglycerate kinase